MHIVWDGWIWDNNSFAIVNRHIVSALVRIGADVRLSPWIDGEPSRERFLDCDLFLQLAQRPRDIESAATIRQSWPVMAPYYNPIHNWSTIQGRLKVGFFIWESEHMPRAWVEAARAVDAIITISPFSQERVLAELRTYGVDTRVFSIPLGVDPRLFSPSREPHAEILRSARRFRFLYVGAWQSRKGSDILRDAYLEEFSDRDDVTLVVQSRGERSANWTELPTGAPHVLVLSEDLPETELGGVYTACHCLVHPARLEGFGMTMLEAMACGVAVLCPDTGGQRAFANASNAVLLPTKPEPYIFPFDLEGTAYRVDRAALRDAMRAVVADRNCTPERIRNGLQTAEQFSWDRCARQIVECLQEIG